MRLHSLTLLALAALSIGARGKSGPPLAEQVHLVAHEPYLCDLRDLYDEAQDRVVRIRTAGSIGSGRVFAASGLIVANAHVRWRRPIHPLGGAR